MNQKGNVLIVTLLLMLAATAGGYYLYSTGKLNLNQYQPNSNTYMLPTDGPTVTIPSSTDAPAATSSKINLTITSPISGVVLKSGVVKLTGKTAPNAEVFVNDLSTKADASGNFTLNLTLDEGSNNLVVTANDSDGNIAEQNLMVNVQTF